MALIYDFNMIPVDLLAPPSRPPVPEVSPSSAAPASSFARSLHPLAADNDRQIRSRSCVNQKEVGALRV